MAAIANRIRFFIASLLSTWGDFSLNFHIMRERITGVTRLERRAHKRIVPDQSGSCKNSLAASGITTPGSLLDVQM